MKDNINTRAADDKLFDEIFGDGAAQELEGHFREYAQTRNELADPAFAIKGGAYTVALADIQDAIAGLTDAQKLAVITGALVEVSKNGSPAIKQRAVETAEITLNALNDEIVKSVGTTQLMSKEDFKVALHGSTLKRLSRGAGFTAEVFAS